jgi:hypothetical protein
MKRSLYALAVVMTAGVLAGDDAGNVAYSAALNSLTATATNTTQPEDVGRRIEVTLSAQILARRKTAPARQCQRGRVFTAEWVKLDGTMRRLISGQPSSRSGRYTGVLDLDYGGTDPRDPDRPPTGDVPFAGGTWSVTVRAGRTQVPGRMRPVTCAALSATAQVAIPPATVDEP